MQGAAASSAAGSGKGATGATEATAVFQGYDDAQERVPVMTVKDGGAGAGKGLLAAAARDPEVELIADVVKELGFEGPVWTSVSTALGLAGGEEVQLLLSVPQGALETAVASIKIPGGTGEEPLAPTTIQLGRAHAIISKIKKLFAEQPVQQLQPAPILQPTINVQAPEPDESKFTYTEILVQGLGGSFTMPVADTLRAMRQRHVTATGCEPEPEERPSDEQLGALSAWLALIKGGRPHAPYVDFAIFGPYGKASLKSRQFMTHALSSRGEWSQKRMPGPASFEEWCQAWSVFRAAMLMSNGAAPHELDASHKGNALLFSRHPTRWSYIGAADDIMRSDQWDLIYEEEVSKNPAVKDEPDPWGVIIQCSAFNGFTGPRAVWWERTLTYPLSLLPAASKSGDGQPPRKQQQPESQQQPPRQQFQHLDSPKGGKGNTSIFAPACWLCGSYDHKQHECPFADGAAA